MPDDPDTADDSERTTAAHDSDDHDESTDPVADSPSDVDSTDGSDTRTADDRPPGDEPEGVSTDIDDAAPTEVNTDESARTEVDTDAGDDPGGDPLDEWEQYVGEYTPLLFALGLIVVGGAGWVSLSGIRDYGGWGLAILIGFVYYLAFSVEHRATAER